MDAANGLVTKPSVYTVDETVAALKKLLEAKGITLFALVDHSGEAEKAGLSMRPTKLLIFGDPRAGTPLMLSAPTCAIDLPLKVLVWEDADGAVRLTYNSPEYLRERHGFSEDLLPNIAGVAMLVGKAAE